MRENFGAVLAVVDPDTRLSPAELGNDVLAQLVPDTGGAGSREGTQLEGGAGQDENGGRNLTSRPSGVLQTDLHPVHRRDAQGPQVDSTNGLGPFGCVGHVPGAGAGRDGRRGLGPIGAAAGVGTGRARSVVPAAGEQSHGDLLSLSGTVLREEWMLGPAEHRAASRGTARSARAVGAHRLTGDVVDVGQRAAMVD